MLIKKIEAREACDWLRAAGFPQYVQLFRDCRLPLDVEAAKRDHGFLDEDSVSSLCRRLNTLNKCLEMKLEPRRSKHRGEDWDEEDFCAISPKWTFDRWTRRWRRLDSNDEVLSLSSGPAGPLDHDVSSIHSSNSTDSDEHHMDLGEPVPSAVNSSTTEEQETSRSSSRCSSTNRTRSLDTSLSGPPCPGGGSSSVSLETEGRFRNKPPRRKCTALLRKMEKLRVDRRHVGGLVLVPDEKTDRRAHPLNPQARSSSRSSSALSTPPTSSSSQSESSSTISTPSPVTRVRRNCKRSNSGVGLTQNDQNHTETEILNQINSSSKDHLVFQVPHGHKPGTFPSSLAHKHILSPVINSTSVKWRTGSFHSNWGQHGSRWGGSSLTAGDQSPESSGQIVEADHRLSIYDNVQLSESDGGSDAEQPEVGHLMAGENVFSALDDVLERISDLQQLVSSWSEDISENDFQRGSSSCQDSPECCSSSCQDSPECGSSSCQESPKHNSSSHVSPTHGSSSSGHIHLRLQHPEEPENQKTRSPRLQKRVSRQLWWSSENLSPQPPGPGLEVQSASHILLLQKMSVLKLTALMDKFSGSSRQGWSWTILKTQRKMLEVTGGRVFGVPLLVSVQQTGEALPPCILRALVYLKTQCLDQVGLFRKSGVKSRIQSLREAVESDPDQVLFQGQSAFDVADLVKQFFRDLPEPVFSTRLCRTFLQIYQRVPQDQQLVAAQAAILLLPEENRAALRTLLLFLQDVTRVPENQMTPTNIAVCLAPSLFHLNAAKRDTKSARSGHRKSSLGHPDQRDLSETLAATQGLSSMIAEAPRLFQLPEFWPGQSLNTPGHTEEVQSGLDGRQRLQLSTQQLLKEAREEGPDWENQPGLEQVDLALKKAEDGCPLGTWRCSVEVDAPQQDLLHRLLREQNLWEQNLRHAAVVQTLSEDSEVYHCILQGPGHDLGSQPPQDHLLLRTWHGDPSSGPLYLSSVSTDHPGVQSKGVRVQVHACLYLLEPTGTMKTRLTHLCRTDTRGRSQDWYSRVSGHLLASGLLAIRDSFRPGLKETKI